jgi:hypothetical protein
MDDYYLYCRNGHHPGGVLRLITLRRSSFMVVAHRCTTVFKEAAAPGLFKQAGV